MAKFTLSLDYWYLSAAEKPKSANFDAASGTYHPFDLPKDLGNELDLYAEFIVTDNIKIDLLSGIFLPGGYYREQRGDGNILGIASAPRFDGGASNAWLIETGITYSF